MTQVAPTRSSAASRAFYSSRPTCFMRLIFKPVWTDIIARKWPQKTLLSALTIAPQESADPLYTALKAPLEPVYDGRHAVHDSLRRNMHRFLALCLLVLS